MSRLDNLGEILDGYEGREYQGEEVRYYLELEDIYKKISEGHEDSNRMGLLIGKILEDGKHEITDVYIPEQNSSPSCAQMLQSWDLEIPNAREKGDIIGTVFYYGIFLAFFSAMSLNTIRDLHKNYGVPEFSIVTNKNKEFEYHTQKK